MLGPKLPCGFVHGGHEAKCCFGRGLTMLRGHWRRLALKEHGLGPALECSSTHSVCPGLLAAVGHWLASSVPLTSNCPVQAYALGFCIKKRNPLASGWKARLIFSRLTRSCFS